MQSRDAETFWGVPASAPGSPPYRTCPEVFVQEVYMKPPSGHFGCGGVTMSVSLKIQTSSFHSFSHHIAPFPGSALSLPQQIVTAPSLLLLRSQTRAWDSWTRRFGAVNSPQAGGQRSMKPAELPDLWAKLQKDVSENSPLASRASGNLGWTSSTPGAHSIHPSVHPSCGSGGTAGHLLCESVLEWDIEV